MIFECSYKLGQRLYLRGASEEAFGYVGRVSFDGGAPYYEMHWPNRATSWHYEFQLSTAHIGNLYDSIPE